MERPKRLTTIVDRFIQTLALRILPCRRAADIFDLLEFRPPNYAFQALGCTVRAIGETAINTALFPGIGIDYGSPTPEEMQKRSDRMLRALRRSTLLFILVFVAYVTTAQEVLRLFVDIPPFSSVVLSVIFFIGLHLQRRSLMPALPGRTTVFESIGPDRYRQELLRKKDMILLARFNPAKSPMQAGAVALTMLLVLFAAAYPIIRWLAEGSLPPDLHPKEAIAFAIAAVLVVAWFFVIWKSSGIAAVALEKQIKKCSRRI